MRSILHRRRPATAREGGQILALFALSLMVIIMICGLAVDAGGTFAQRRDQQTAADLAALAAANDYLINGDVALADGARPDGHRRERLRRRRQRDDRRVRPRRRPTASRSR